MGTEFSIVYDVLAAGILIGMLFAGCKKGFASAVVSLAAVAVAFFCAMAFSPVVTDWVYTGMVEKPVKDSVNIALDEAMDAIKLDGLSDIDYDEIVINTTRITDVAVDYSGTNKVMIDLSVVDFSRTGMDDADLSLFGIAVGTDLSSVNAKTAEFTRADIQRYGLPKLVVAQYIAVNMQKTSMYENFADFAEGIGNAVPLFFGQMSEDISKGSIPALRSVVLVMLESSVSVRDAVIGGIVEPCVKIAVQTITFGIIFILVALILGVAAKLLKFVNKIPLIGGINIFLGGVLGVVEGVFGVFISCLIVRLIITLTGGNIMFLSDTAVNATFIFKFFYNFDFLNFLS